VKWFTPIGEKFISLLACSILKVNNGAFQEGEVAVMKLTAKNAMSNPKIPSALFFVSNYFTSYSLWIYQKSGINKLFCFALYAIIETNLHTL
jgi:hypothetical protein